jgi:outer membrane protein assembly factor BamB
MSIVPSAPDEARVYVGIGGVVLALDREQGAELWRTKLKGWSANFVNLVLHPPYLYAIAGGELHTLDAASGQLRWKDELKGLGYGLATLAPGDNQAALLAEHARQAAQAASS